MSLSTRTLVLTTVAVVAAGSLGYAVVTRDGDRSDRGARVVAAPVEPVEAVRADGDAQAALIVSNRFFQRSRVAVLTSEEDAARTEAIATATRLRVPVLLDDTTGPADDLEALVLLQEAPDHPVAAATAAAAGARVVEIGEDDLRSDGSVAQILAAEPDAAALALGADVDADTEYEISAINGPTTRC